MKKRKTGKEARDRSFTSACPTAPSSLYI